MSKYSELDILKQRELKENQKPANEVFCPICHKSDRVVFIYRPEIYEYNFYCCLCEKGFDD